MASINQLTSEIAHSVQAADNVPVRRAIKLAIIHVRNQLIRQSFEQHGYTDKALKQRFRISLIDVPDADLNGTLNLNLPVIKRTSQRVPRPTRLTNNLPFHSVRTAGVNNPIEIPFVQEASSKFYAKLPGMCPCVTYDYINGFIYINTINSDTFKNLGSIIIESIFEDPREHDVEYFDTNKNDVSEIANDDDEFIVPEDMIGNLKKLVLETYNIQIVRQTGEAPTPNLVK